MDLIFTVDDRSDRYQDQEEYGDEVSERFELHSWRIVAFDSDGWCGG
jgi:hypothetical protein